MDPIDYKIVRTLQRDGRMSNRELAEEVGLSPSPCLRRLKTLESSGLIQGYHADVDPGRFGFNVTAFIRIRLERHDEATVNAFEARIQQLDRVLECHVMTGRSDYLLRVIARDLRDYERFVRRDLQRIGGIASIDTSFAYGAVKKTAIYPKPD